jgi:hypothetical protein
MGVSLPLSRGRALRGWATKGRTSRVVVVHRVDLFNLRHLLFPAARRHFPLLVELLHTQMV